jgi:alkyl hydroperoxide reductase subunit AhpC
MLKPGDPIPPFDLPAFLDVRSGRVTLVGIRSEPEVLFFYPRDFSFICPTEVMRATFLLDKMRAVIFAEASPINVGRSVDETLRIVRAYCSGRPCPADWEPGDALVPGDRKY